MARKKRKMPSLNTTSTADISFMLLIFFLVTTSMDTDRGLGRTLPKPPEDEEQQNEIDVKERNLAAPDRRTVDAFLKRLELKHISATIRREMGADIEGACGQLRRKVLSA